MALYMSSVYLLSLPGGWIADRFLGQRKAVTVGGIGITLGNAHARAADDALFYPGPRADRARHRACSKPNISTIVGQLYKPEDIRRDAGFTIYYMGINIGAVRRAARRAASSRRAHGFRAFLDEPRHRPEHCAGTSRFGAAGGRHGRRPHPVRARPAAGSARPACTRRSRPTRRAPRATAACSAAIVGALVALIARRASSSTARRAIDGDCIGERVRRRPADRRGRAVRRPLQDGARPRRAQAHHRDDPAVHRRIAFFAHLRAGVDDAVAVRRAHSIHRELLGFTSPRAATSSSTRSSSSLLAPVFAGSGCASRKESKEPSSVNKFAIGMVFIALSFVVMLPTLSTRPRRQRRCQLHGIEFSSLVSPTTSSSSTSSRRAPSCASRRSACRACRKLAPQRLAGMVMGTW